MGDTSIHVGVSVLEDAIVKELRLQFEDHDIDGIKIQESHARQIAVAIIARVLAAESKEEVTPAMMDAGVKVLWDSGIVEYEASFQRLVVKEIFEAMSANPSTSDEAPGKSHE